MKQYKQTLLNSWHKKRLLYTRVDFAGSFHLHSCCLYSLGSPPRKKNVCFYNGYKHPPPRPLFIHNSDFSTATADQKWRALKLFSPCCPPQSPLSFIDNSLLSLRIWAVRATFKTVLMAVDKTYALQTKRKTCFGGPRMILQAQLKNTFSKLGCGF